MPRFLISFDDGSMDHIPVEELGEVGEAAHAVAREAKAAGVWIFGCGLQRQQAVIVSPDGTVNDGPFPETKAVVAGSLLSRLLISKMRFIGPIVSLKLVAASKRFERLCSIPSRRLRKR